MGNDESSGEIGKVLGSAAAPLEEAKADVMGVWNMLYKVTRKCQFQTMFIIVYLIHNYNWIMQLRCHRQILVQQWTASSSALKLVNNDFCFHLSEL